MLAPPNPLLQTLVRMSLQFPPGTHKGHSHYTVGPALTNGSEVTCFYSIMLASKEDADDWRAPRSQGFLNHN